MDLFRMTKLPVRSAIAAAAISAGLLGAARSAEGALTVTLSEPGFAPVTVTDTTNSGAVDYFGAYGDFSTNFVVGISDRLTSAGPTADLEIQSLDVTNISNLGGKMLTVTLSDSGYLFPLTAGSTVALGSSIGGTLTQALPGDAVTFQSYVTSPAVSTGLQTFVTPASPGPSTAFSSVATPVNFVRGASFALSDVTTISLAGAGDTANISGTTTVSALPEPTAVSLLAAAGATLLSRRRRRN